MLIYLIYNRANNIKSSGFLDYNVSVLTSLPSAFADACKNAKTNSQWDYGPIISIRRLFYINKYKYPINELVLCDSKDTYMASLRAKNVKPRQGSVYTKFLYCH